MLCRVNLEFEGFRVVEAADGERAVAAAREASPDLILLDTTMPNTDGWETLLRLQADPDLRGIPVVMLTARVEEEARQRALRGGAVAYVTKPFRPSELVGTVNTLMGR